MIFDEPAGQSQRHDGDDVHGGPRDMSQEKERNAAVTKPRRKQWLPF